MPEDKEVSDKIKASPEHFAVEFSLIMIGLAFGYGVEQVVQNPSVAVIFRFLTLLVLLAIWLHSQVGFSSSETYLAGTHWGTRIAEYYMEIINLVIPLFAALNIGNEILFYGLIILAFASDMILDIIYLIRLRLEKIQEIQEKNLTKSWIRNDITTIALALIVVYFRIQGGGLSEIWASVIFLMVVFTLSLIDYYVNRDFYFGFMKKPQSKNHIIFDWFQKVKRK